MKTLDEFLAEQMKKPEFAGAYYAEAAREIGEGLTDRTVNHDDAVIAMLRDEPDFAGHYLRAALADIAEEGGQEGFYIAVQHVSRAFINFPKLDPVLLAVVQLPKTGDEAKDYEYALALVECLLCIDENNPLVDGLCALISAYEDKDPDIIAFRKRCEAIPPALGTLRTLMNQYQLGPQDFAQEIGDADTVMRILSGTEQLTPAAIDKLAARFRIPASLFV